MVASVSFAVFQTKCTNLQSARRRPVCSTRTTRMAVQPDVVIVGGGVIGLSTAFELAQAGKKVRVLVRDVSESASQAGAGMLAPVSEGIHFRGDLQRLCAISRSMYPKFVHSIQSTSGKDVQYVSQQDFLLPLLQDEATLEVPGGTFLDTSMLKNIEPALGPAVRGAVRVPSDAHVNNRLLASALRDACRNMNVDISEGINVQKLQISPGGASVEGLVTDCGDIITAPHFVAACGAWTNKLVKGVPIRPVKGQMLCLKPLAGKRQSTPPLQHVLYGRDVYIVSKENYSMYFVGATVEEQGYCRSTTAGGILKLLNAATTLVPSFADYYIAETWAGLRPGTPDQKPIIGKTGLENLTVATGTFRNGILLAPAVGKLTAACALGEEGNLSFELQRLLKEFSLMRFLDSLPGHAETNEPRDTISPKEIGPSSTTSTSVGREPIAAPQNGVVSSERGNGPMMWQLLPDGTQKPVRPSSRFLKSKGIVSDEEPDESEHDHEDDEGYTNPNWVHGISNDAYEDVMQYRNNPEEAMRKGGAENRQFGRTKSAIEAHGVVLSMSAEEEAAFDAAFDKAQAEIATWDDTALTQKGVPIPVSDKELMQSEFP